MVWQFFVFHLAFYCKIEHDLLSVISHSSSKQLTICRVLCRVTACMHVTLNRALFVCASNQNKLEICMLQQKSALISFQSKQWRFSWVFLQGKSNKEVQSAWNDSHFEIFLCVFQFKRQSTRTHMQTSTYQTEKNYTTYTIAWATANNSSDRESGSQRIRHIIEDEEKNNLLI